MYNKLPWYKKIWYKIQWFICKNKKPYVPIVSLEDIDESEKIAMEIDLNKYYDFTVKDIDEDITHD